MKTISSAIAAVLLLTLASGCVTERQVLCQDRNLYEYQVETTFGDVDTLAIRDCDCEITGSYIGMQVKCEHITTGYYRKISLFREIHFPISSR